LIEGRITVIARSINLIEGGITVDPPSINLIGGGITFIVFHLSRIGAIERR